LVLAENEAAPLTLQKLEGLEVGQQAIAHQGARQEPRLVGKRAGTAQALDVRFEPWRCHHAALAHQVEKLPTCRRGRHSLPPWRMGLVLFSIAKARPGAEGARMVGIAWRTTYATYPEGSMNGESSDTPAYYSYAVTAAWF